MKVQDKSFQLISLLQSWWFHFSLTSSYSFISFYFISFFASPFAVPPNIIDEESSADISVQEGDDAMLTCRATGHPPPRVTWKREDGEVMLLRKGSSRELIKGIYNAVIYHFLPPLKTHLAWLIFSALISTTYHAEPQYLPIHRAAPLKSWVMEVH